MAKKKKGMDLRKKAPASQRFAETIIRLRWPLILLVFGGLAGFGMLKAELNSFVFSMSEYLSIQLEKFTVLEDSLKSLSNSYYNLALIASPIALYLIFHLVFSRSIVTLLFFPFSLMLTAGVFIGLNGSQEVISYIYIGLFTIGFILTIFSKNALLILPLPLLIVAIIGVTVSGSLWLDFCEGIDSIEAWYFITTLNVIIAEALSLYYRAIKGLKKGQSKAGAIATGLQMSIKYMAPLTLINLILAGVQLYPALKFPQITALQAIYSHIVIFSVVVFLVPALLTIFPLQRLKSKKRKV